MVLSCCLLAAFNLLDARVEIPRTGNVVIGTLNGNVYCGKMFIDATYEGDLMAAAGVSYVVGRESNRTYGEQNNGNAPNAVGAANHNLEPGVSP